MSHDDKHTATRHRLAIGRLILPTLLILAAYGFRAFTDAHHIDHLAHLTATMLWLSAAFLLIRLLDVLVWRYLMESRGRHVPQLVRDLVAILILLGAGGLVLSLVFDQSITTLLAASTVGLGVLGFALKHPILDAFSGIILTMQKPFQTGDWLELETGELARVVDINWRDVHLVSANEITYLVPNSQFIEKGTKIYSQPENFFRDEITIALPYHVTTHQGQRILLGSVNQVEEIAALPRQSIVTIVDYTDSGVLWRLLYWCPDPARVPTYRFLVHQNILRNLHYANIDIPFPVRVLQRDHRTPNPSADAHDIDPLIQRVSLFASLTAEELRHLSAEAKSRLVHAGVALLRQGDAGDSLFILREGLLEVRKATEQHPETVLDHIRPGQFFGEMSLLLGDPRSATIVAAGDAVVMEITKEAMTKLMHDRPELASYLAELLAQRQAQAAAKLAANRHVAEPPHGLLEQLASRINQFFGLGKLPPPARRPH
jgi:small-conductance mechanosensitive channel/CRP-like cAMP-binding protein